MKKRIICSFLASVMAVGALVQSSPAVLPILDTDNSVTASAEQTDAKFNYAEALQKSLYFYECQQAGPLPSWNRVQWRADSTMHDFIQGGWYDAGDHVKFNLPMAFSASVMAWGLYEYADGIDAVGQGEIYRNNLEFVLDYLAKCDLGDEVVYQIGNGAADHKWWGCAELVELEMERPYYTCKASCVTAEMAAALAAGAAALGKDNPKYETYLEHAENLFKIADTTRSDEDYKEAAGFYDSWSGFWDELFYSANWLYIATGNKDYLDKATSYIPNLGRENQSTELKYTWSFCWDDTMQGAMLLYARNTGDPTYIQQFQKHLDYWTVGYGGKQVKEIDGGLKWLDQWGCLRYACNTAFLASVWADYIDDAALKKRYTDFAETQINYCLGDNPRESSYVVGFGENAPQHPHHRTSHGPWLDDNGKTPENHRHVLYGALVGGPSQDGSYQDDINNFTNNEVATDYNAGYTAMLCNMVSKYGGKTLENFPEKETPDGPEFYMEACINQASNNFTEVKALATNHSAWPARVIKDLSYNYYFDLSEVFDAGYDVSDVVVKKGYDEWSDTEISEPIQYKDNIYYIKISYPDGSVVAPIGQEQHQAEIQFRISVPDGTNFWNPENDYSYDGLLKDNQLSITDKITMYDGDKLIYGVEPDGTKPDDSNVTTTTTTTTEATTTTTAETSPTETTTSVTTSDSASNTTTSSSNPSNKGDINGDGKVNIADLFLLAQYVANITDLNSSQLSSADMNDDGKTNIADLFALAQIIAQ